MTSAPYCSALATTPRGIRVAIALCMLFAAGFFYVAAFLLMKGLPL